MSGRYRAAHDGTPSFASRAPTMNISEPYIRRPVATSLLMTAIGFVGLVALPFLPVAPLPQVDFPTISVNATLQGASAETMAASVAAPLERQFEQIPGGHATDLGERLERDLHHHPIRSQPQHQFRGPDMQGGDHGRGQDAATADVGPTELQEGQPGQFTDHDAGRPVRHAAAHHRQRLRRQFSGPADFAGPWRRPGGHRRRAASRDSHPGRPGQARLERPDTRGGAQHPGSNDHDCGEGHGQHGADELHHCGQRSDHRPGTVRRCRARLSQWPPVPGPQRRPAVPVRPTAPCWPTRTTSPASC